MLCPDNPCRLARYSTSRSETQRCLSDAFSSSDHEYGGYTSPRKATDLLASGIRSLRARSRPLIGGIGRRYAVLNHGQQRNVSSYIVHLLLDTAGFIWLLSLLSDVWCMCGELAMHLQVCAVRLSLALIGSLMCFVAPSCLTAHMWVSCECVKRVPCACACVCVCFCVCSLFRSTLFC